MKKTKLSKEEKALLDSVESGKFQSTLSEARRKELEAVANNTFKKDKRISIRLSNRDLLTRRGRWKSLVVRVVNLDSLVDNLAEFSKYRLFIVAVTSAENQSRRTADVALVIF